MNHMPNDLSHLSDEEFQALCPQGEHATGPFEAEPPGQPLWAAMLDAYLSTSCFGATVETDKAAWAAEIRAVADWLLPEEPEPQGVRVAADTYSRQRIRQHQRQELRQRLLAEADRAERGEVKP